MCVPVAPAEAVEVANDPDRVVGVGWDQYYEVGIRVTVGGRVRGGGGIDVPLGKVWYVEYLRRFFAEEHGIPVFGLGGPNNVRGEVYGPPPVKHIDNAQTGPP